jgi:hypothetical protein
MECPWKPAPLRAYLVDDEPLAIERLTTPAGKVSTALHIAGSATDPAQ